MRTFSRSLLFVAAALPACGARTEIDDGFPGASDSGVDVGGPGRVDAGRDGGRPPHDTGIEAEVISPPPPRDAGTGQVVLYDPSAPVDADSTWTWQGTWVSANVTLHPPPRDGTALASTGTELILFGGLGPDGNLLADTWTWTGNAWDEATPSTSPSPREFHSLATLGSTVVLFGGTDGTSSLGDTWTWDGAAWTEAHPPVSPPPRGLAEVATLGDTVVLYGGSGGLDATGNTLGDTWLWDGAAWTEVKTPVSPPPQFGQAMASLGDTVVLFVPNFDGDALDTWVFDGTGWSAQPVPPAPPPALSGFGLATFGPLVLLYGGTSPTGAAEDTTYGWTGSSWQDLGVAAGPLTYAGQGSTPYVMATLTR